MGSSSLPVSGACGSNESLNGLKFGKKIYFEDVGSGSSSSSTTPPAAAPKKGKGVAQGGQQPPRCQVEGCEVDLTGTKAYYCRHKVCGMHSKSPKVIVAGLEQRFCQQCSRFHQLSEFDQGKRSCRRRLAGHNERRRKPPPGPLPSRYGRLSSYYHEDNRFRGFLMDFTHSRPPGTARDVWPTTLRHGDRVAGGYQWQGCFSDPPPNGVATHGTHPYVQGLAGGTFFPSPGIPPDECLPGITNSSCALSLLSSQPWGPNTARNRAPTIAENSSFDAAPMAQPLNYMTNPWGFKGHEACSSSHEIQQHEMGLGQVMEPGDGQFPDELELALQGNRQCMDLGSGRAYDQSSHAMHWSL